MSRRHLSEYISELVENTLSELEECKCVAIEDVDVTPLNLGMIAAHYYIAYTTVELFGRLLTPKSKQRALLEILCAATEFDELPMRHKEDRMLEKVRSA